MDKEKIGTVIEPLETDWPGAKNMFDTPLGSGYARRFDEVYHATLEKQDELMKKLYEDATADETLNEEQMRIIKACYVGYNEATCKNGVSTPLIAFVSSKKPDLGKRIRTMRKKKNKMVDSGRLKRTVEDLYGITERIGFEFEVALLPEMMKTIETRFIKKDGETEDNQLAFESLVLAAISLFARRCSPTSYANLWYVVCLMKRIQLLSYMPSNMLQTTPEIKPRLLNLVKTIKTIQILEMQRSGALQPIPGMGAQPYQPSKELQEAPVPSMGQSSAQ